MLLIKVAELRTIIATHTHEINDPLITYFKLFVHQFYEEI